MFEGGIGRIWFSSITSWADRFGVIQDDLPTFLRLVRALDQEYVDVVNEKLADDLKKMQAEK